MVSAASLAGIALGALITFIAGVLLGFATDGRDWQRLIDADDGPRRAWCPMCERHTPLLRETKIVAERRDEHHDGDIGCRIIDGHHYTIRIGSITLPCANCGSPHETSEATR